MTPKQIIENFRLNEKNTHINKTLFDILEGKLYDNVDEALKNSFISDRSYANARKKISSINIIKKLINKLSKIYSESPTRVCENSTDQEILDFYVDELDFDNSMSEANKLFNLTKSVAVEPSVYEGKVSLRVMPSHTFLPCSDSVINPNQETSFTKYMGKKDNSDIYFNYTNETFLAFNEGGQILPEYMQENEGINPYGVIPQTYINRSKYLLIPMPDKDLLQMGILIPSLITNLNFAVEFMTHSIVYGIDVESDNLERNPDVFWSLHSDAQGNKPEIGQIKPEVDIESVMGLIKDQLSMFFETRNIKSTGNSQGTTDSVASGLALMIREIDTTEDRKEQIKVFKNAEEVFWSKLKLIHNHWAQAGMVSERRQFSESFAPVIDFKSPKPIEDKTQIIDRQIKLIDEGLTTKMNALREINPSMDESELEQLEKDINDEKELEVNVKTTENNFTDKKEVETEGEIADSE